MESFITVHYETTRITLQNRGSGSSLGFEEEHPHLASKISKSWLGEKKCKNANSFKNIRGVLFTHINYALKQLGLF